MEILSGSLIEALDFSKNHKKDNRKQEDENGNIITKSKDGCSLNRIKEQLMDEIVTDFWDPNRYEISSLLPCFLLNL